MEVNGEGYFKACWDILDIAAKSALHFKGAKD